MNPLSLMESLKFPKVDERHGLAPANRKVQPAEYLTETGGSCPLEFPLKVESPVVLDFGNQMSGRIFLEVEGEVDCIYASDLAQLRHLEEMDGNPSLFYDCHNTYVKASPWGTVRGRAGQVVMLEKGLSVLRLLRVSSKNGAVIHRCWVEFSPPHMPLDGAFHCDDPELNRIWHMGVYTVQLCTQNNMDSIDGVPAAGSGYVIWDGVRRDREVWAGDLRPSCLAWLSAFGNSEPVRNSLYHLYHTRHLHCEESGMITGSSSSHQIFYEWTFWFIINCWEYYLWSGDAHFLESLMAPGGLEMTLDWMLNKANANGIIETKNSWMWTLKIEGEVSSQAIVQVGALEALARIFTEAGRRNLATRALDAARQLREEIPRRFYNPETRSMSIWPHGTRKRYHVSLDAQAFSILFKVGDEALRKNCLEAMDAGEFKCAAGLRCQYPAFTDEQDGEWHINPATNWMHNTTVWPYVNGYAAWAQMEAGALEKGLQTLKNFHRPHVELGSATLWELMLEDGSSPIPRYGNLGSLCHAWGGTGAYLLHRYILGITPTAPGFTRAAFAPQLGELNQVQGRVPTPLGVIEVEMEKKKGKPFGKISLPESIELEKLPEGFERVSR